MGLAYKNLDSSTRLMMLVEIEMDVASGSIYLSNYLSAEGKNRWPDLLRAAAQAGNDDTLADSLAQNGLLRLEAERRKPTGGISLVKVPHTASVTMGEGEFGRYYVRALCRRAINDNLPYLVVYRAKSVAQPRPGSEGKIGKQIDPRVILDDLRSTIGVEPLLGLPPGSNSGLTLCLPE